MNLPEAAQLPPASVFTVSPNCPLSPIAGHVKHYAPCLQVIRICCLLADHVGLLCRMKTQCASAAVH